MKLGFYYHIPIQCEDGQLFMPGYLAVFIDALAREAGELILFMHEAREADRMHCDTALTAAGISWKNLGEKSPAWRRSLFHKSVLKNYTRELSSLDILLVRGPSALAPYFRRYMGEKTKIAYFVIGDYRESGRNYPVNTFRQLVIKNYLFWNDRAFSKALKNQLILVNSIPLFQRYQKITPTLFEVRTTTLSGTDFFSRSDTCTSKTIRLAYIGRFDLQKGLLELVKAAAQLSRSMEVEIHFTGWEDDASGPMESAIKRLAEEEGVSDKLFFHGKKTVGEALNVMYRQADIYLIPSYQEGFPRTIWEAMANSCPVIATRVGSIPHYLEHEHHALLIEPKDVGGIVQAVKRMVSDEALRQTLIRNGYALAQTNTLEIQTKRLIQILNDHIRN